jgi:hypothetical protein
MEVAEQVLKVWEAHDDERAALIALLDHQEWGFGGVIGGGLLKAETEQTGEEFAIFDFDGKQRVGDVAQGLGEIGAAQVAAAAQGGGGLFLGSLPGGAHS